MNNLAGDVKISGRAIGEVTIATTNADGSMRDLSDILADCRVAFGNLTESEKANAAESLVGKNAMSGLPRPCERCACGYRQAQRGD